MSYVINRAMVIGAGIMGAGIAGHLASAGIPVYLVDVVPNNLLPEEEKRGLTLESPSVRNRIVNKGLEFLKKVKPPALSSVNVFERITPGNLEDHFDWAGESDWIIEVVIEDLKIKRQVMAEVESARKQGSIVSTNTSGLPIRDIAHGRTKEFKTHFLGTHFFNPVRYLKLLEIIPTPETESGIVDFFKEFGQRRLGKTVVICNDTPNFIANRVGVVTSRASLNRVLDNDYSIEAVDAITGLLMGRPKTATFRVLDLIGTDINQHVSDNLYKAIPHDGYREELRGSGNTLIKNMVDRGLLGNKTGQGFYKKTDGPNGEKIYLALDLNTLKYRPMQALNIPFLEEAKKIDSLPERFKFLVGQKDRYGKLIWSEVAFTLSYCSQLLPEITDTLYAIDDAIKAGFGHEMGPFELWDTLGVKETADRMVAVGYGLAPWVKEMVEAGGSSFYDLVNGKKSYWDLAHHAYRPIPIDPHILNLANRKQEVGIIHENPSASLIDLGDGVLCLEFHSKSNTLDQNVEAMGHQALEELENNHIGLVIGNQGKNFSTGANVSALLMAIEEKQWDGIEKMVKRGQEQILRFRDASRPVVAAPFGMTLGAGAEICMAAHRICAAAETYMGLVEVGMGLMPVGGGCCELIKRLVSPVMKVAESDALPFLVKAFETIAMAKVSTSALEAREMGFIREEDRIIMNGDHLLKRAKTKVIQMDADGYLPPIQGSPIYALGKRGMAYLMQLAQSMVWSGFITEHDKHVADKLAYVLSGGPLSSPQWVNESYILDLEREAFLSLCGEEKTRLRIQHMLRTGKPLRN